MSALERAPRGRLIDLGAEILDRVDAAILVVDLDGVVLYANPYCSHLYGRTPEELVGEQSARFAIEPLHAELRSEIGAKILNGESWEGDFAVLRALARRLAETPLWPLWLCGVSLRSGNMERSK